jgi:hypothetical protein
MKRFILALLILLPLATSGIARAGWPLSGLFPFEVGSELAPFLVADGTGGALVVGNNAADAVIVQRVNREGSHAWPNTAAVASSSGRIEGAVPDGSGGVIVVWSDNGYDGYARRVSGAGTPMGDANGTKLFDSWRVGPVVVADGIGGAAVFFARENLVGFQHMAPDGELLLAHGRLIATTTASQYYPEMQAIRDGEGGYIVMWRFDPVSGLDEWHAQRVDAVGNPAWGPSGIVVDDVAGLSLAMASDGAGGFVAVWEVNPVGFRLVKAQRVDASGNQLWGGGVYIGNGDRHHPQICADGEGAWLVAYTVSTSWQSGTLHVQRIDSNGVSSWPENGIEVLPTWLSFHMLPDGDGGALIAAPVQDASLQRHLWVQRVSLLGTLQWTTPLVPIPGVDNSLIPPASVITEDGFAIVGHSGETSRVQRVDLYSGVVGHPNPRNVAAADNPSDQGGRVLVEWDASERDSRATPVVTHYSVWRSPPGLGDWTEVGSQPARYAASYSLLVPTPADDTPYDWKARAHTSDPLSFWDSGVVTAASADNLSPAAPVGLTASISTSGVALSWSSGNDDAVAYAVFRDTASGVVPGDAARIATVTSTDFTDHAMPAGGAFYVVAAIDGSGHMSAPSNEVAARPAAGAGTPSLARLEVGANVPNPFAGTTTLRVGLPQAGAVSIEVFDVAGRRVALRREPVGAGWNAIPFDGRNDSGRALASGVYLYRVTAAGETMTRKLVIQR